MASIIKRFLKVHFFIKMKCVNESLSCPWIHYHSAIFRGKSGSRKSTRIGWSLSILTSFYRPKRSGLLSTWKHNRISIFKAVTAKNKVIGSNWHRSLRIKEGISSFGKTATPGKGKGKPHPTISRKIKLYTSGIFLG